MNSPNDAPRSDLELPSGPSAAMNELAKGQKWLIYAFMIYSLAGVFREVPAASGALALTALFLGISGLIKSARNLGWETWEMVLVGILLFIPLLGLIALLVISSKTTKRLRKAGYEVGFFGAKPRG